jgi:hypothetical protein
MIGRLRSSILSVFVLASAAALGTMSPVSASDGVAVGGSFTMSYAYSLENYCGAGEGDLSFEAQGIGRLTGLGPVFMTVKKCYRFADGEYTGTFTVAGAAGDSLRGTYRGTQDPFDANGFGPFHGVLTITGGTGRFRYLRGALNFEAVSSPDVADAYATPGSLGGMAFYILDGQLRSERH